MLSKCPVCEHETDIPIFRSKRCSYCGSLLKRFVEGDNVVLLAILVLLPWLRDIKVVERSPFCCKSCGYNLTGNQSGVCPECGTPISAAGTTP